MMDYSYLFDVLIQLSTPFVSLWLSYLFLNKREDRRLQLLANLTKKIKDDNYTKFEVCEIFRQITKLRMNYLDMEHLIKDDNVILLVYFLNKYPKYLRYESQKLSYYNNFKNSILRKSSTYFSIFAEWFFFILTLIALLLFAFSENSYQTVYSGILLFCFGFAWTISKNSNEDDARIEKLIIGE